MSLIVEPDFARAVQVLLAWAHGCLVEVLGGEQAKPVDGVILLDLEPMLGPLFASPREFERLARRARRCVSLTDRQVRQPLSVAIARTLRCGPVATAYRRLLAGIGVTRPTSLPNALWPLIAELAWRKPRFRNAVAREIGAFLRLRQLFIGGELPVAVLRPETFWLLIDLIGVTQLRAERRLRIARPLGTWVNRWVTRRAFGITWRGSISEIADRLTAVAQAQLHGKLWAGFWDQWLIGEMVLRRQAQMAVQPEGPGFGQLLAAHSPHALRVLAGLPWLREAPYRGELKELLILAGSGEPAAIADPNWQHQMPQWLQTEPAEPAPEPSQLKTQVDQVAEEEEEGCSNPT